MSQRITISKGCEPLACVTVTEAGGLAWWLPCPPTRGRRLGAGTGGFHHAGRVLSRLLESGFYETSRGVGPTSCRRPGSEGHFDCSAAPHTPRASQGLGALTAPALTALGIHSQNEMQAQEPDGSSCWALCWVRAFPGGLWSRGRGGADAWPPATRSSCRASSPPSPSLPGCRFLSLCPQISQQLRRKLIKNKKVTSCRETQAVEQAKVPGWPLIIWCANSGLHIELSSVINKTKVYA